jgi:hypothetical protein
MPAPPPGSNNAPLMEGINPKGLFTGDVVKALAGKLVDFQKNGGTVRTDDKRSYRGCLQRTLAGIDPQGVPRTLRSRLGA